jgi:hypothetical protein
MLHPGHCRQQNDSNKLGLLLLCIYSMLRTESSAKKKCGVVQREWKGTGQVIFLYFLGYFKGTVSRSGPSLFWAYFDLSTAAARFQNIRGTNTRLIQDFQIFMNLCPPSPEYPIRTVSNFFRKFAVIFANECLSAVSTTPAIKQKTFHV